MHEVDVAILDQMLEPAGIGEKSERVLARHGKLDDLAAGLNDGGCHAAPFSGDEGSRTGAGERFGDLDGRLLTASGIEARHDLQYGHLCHGWRASFLLGFWRACGSPCCNL
jgi:hypothetical protein